MKDLTVWHFALTGFRFAVVWNLRHTIWLIDLNLLAKKNISFDLRFANHWYFHQQMLLDSIH